MSSLVRERAYTRLREIEEDDASGSRCQREGTAAQHDRLHMFVVPAVRASR